MISKRNRRSGRPQEILRQFALNNSKGVDSSKAPTDFNTVSAAKNLIVNPDGSMSLRKPIVCIPPYADSKVTKHRLYKDDCVLIVQKMEDTSSFPYAICIQKDGVVQPIKVLYNDYTGQSVSKTVSDGVLTFIVPNGDAETFNLNTASIIGNCDVLLDFFTNLIDPSLYEPTVDRVPRYLQVYYADDDAVWTVEVKQPEVNTLTTAEGEIALNPNMTLDNPTAIRDTYDVSVPSIKGIVAYAATRISNNTVVPARKSPISHSKTYELKPTARLGGNDGSSVHTLVFEHTLVPVNSSLKTRAETRLTTFSESNPDILKINTHLSFELSPVYYAFKFEVSYTHDISYTTNSASEPETNWAKHSIKGSYEFTYTGTEISLRGYNSWTDSTNPLGAPVKAAKVTTTYTIKCTRNADTLPVPSRISDLTESVKPNRHRIVNAFKKDNTTPYVLKAFCNLPNSTGYYATWYKSTSPTSWEPVRNYNVEGLIKVRELDSNWKPNPYVDKDAPSSDDYVNRYYYPLVADSEQDLLFSRIDALAEDTSLKASYRFKIITVEQIEEGDPEYIESDKDAYRIHATIAQQDYTPVFKNDFEFFDVDFGNAVYGKKLYHKKSIYSYGSEKFLNNIFVSDIDSFITPLYNMIDLDTHEASQATCIVPWRDYLISATENAIYLHSKQSEGFLTKTVNTSIGIPEEDSKCCKSVLNGILFKSGPKIYQMYPNMYAGDDSTLNLTEISKPVEEYLESYEMSTYAPFAFSTDAEYILMLPASDYTLCLRYDYSSKLWTVCEYPIVAQYYEMLDLNDIRIFGKYNEFFSEFKFDSTATGTYGDTLPVSATENSIVPIKFEWDTGQKTDNISLTKQFVESKLMFATEDTLEYFPMQLTVHVDGDPHVTRLDLNSDAPFWKESDSKGVTNTLFRLSDASTTGVLRQLITRYSGKGRSVRHILTGTPTSNFRLYETYVRYKLLNVKR